MRTCYKCIAEKVECVSVVDARTLDVRLDWKLQVNFRAIPIPDPSERWFIPKFSPQAKGARLTLERLWELHIGSISLQKEKVATQGTVPNRVNVPWWMEEELSTISDDSKPPQHIRQKPRHMVRKDLVFCIPITVIAVENEIIEVSVQQCLFDSGWGLYRNPHFSVTKKNAIYCMIISHVSENGYRLECAATWSKIEEFSEPIT